MARPKKRSRNRDNVFFAALEEGSTVGEAAKLAGYSRSSVYEYAEEDKEFKSQFDDARADLIEKLEKEADRRAIEGVVDYKSLKTNSGHKVVQVKRYSDSLLMFRLKALKPETYRESYTLDESNDLESPPIAINFAVSDPVKKIEVTRGTAKT